VKHSVYFARKLAGDPAKGFTVGRWLQVGPLTLPEDWPENDWRVVNALIACDYADCNVEALLERYFFGGCLVQDADNGEPLFLVLPKGTVPEKSRHFRVPPCEPVAAAVKQASLVERLEGLLAVWEAGARSVAPPAERGGVKLRAAILRECQQQLRDALSSPSSEALKAGHDGEGL
jgi:hypothetical protein